MGGGGDTFTCATLGDACNFFFLNFQRMEEEEYEDEDEEDSDNLSPSWPEVFWDLFNVTGVIWILSTELLGMPGTRRVMFPNIAEYLFQILEILSISISKNFILLRINL